jgi:DNA-binding NarL/FixJ family response regulator
MMNSMMLTRRAAAAGCVAAAGSAAGCAAPLPDGDTNTMAQIRLRQLTDREHEVMAYLVSGLPNKLIAAELGVSQRTIEAHRGRIFEKMQVRNAVQLVRCLVGDLPVWARYAGRT